MDQISNFSGHFRFLSNFYSSPFVVTRNFFVPNEFSGSTMESSKMFFDNNEQFYHFSKAKFFDDFEVIEEILNTPDPKACKALGRKVRNFDTKSWTEVAPKYMLQGLNYKFDQNPDLAKRLIDTAPAMLIEGNTWGDTFWGVCKGKGLNYLGLLLMLVRNKLSTAE